MCRAEYNGEKENHQWKQDSKAALYPGWGGIWDKSENKSTATA